MSLFVQTNRTEFAPSENAKMRKAVHAVIAANRLRKPHSKLPMNTWYMDGIKMDRRGYSEALAKKNKETLTRVEYETSDKSWSTDDGLASFCDKTRLGDYVGTIPGMTYGLMYVLSLLDIHFVSQMLAELIKNITDEEENIEVANSYFQWLKSIVKGTIGEGTNMHKVTFAMIKYAEEKGLYYFPEQ